MSEAIEVEDLFELELVLPDAKIAAASKRLVGFEGRYRKLHRDLRQRHATGGHAVAVPSDAAPGRRDTGQGQGLLDRRYHDADGA